jgi:hypothetical protein
MRALCMTIDAKSPVKEKETGDSTAGYIDDEDKCCKCVSTVFRCFHCSGWFSPWAGCVDAITSDIDDEEDVGLLDNDELNAKLWVLKHHVTANSTDLRQFKKCIATSRANRKKHLLKLSRKIDLVEEDPMLPPDMYSFFSNTRCKVHGESGSWQCPELTFGIALSILLTQIATLTFLAVDVIDIGNEDNPLGIPPGSLAIIIIFLRSM